MPFFPTAHFPRHHLAQLLGAACIARLWLGFAWLMLLSLCRSASLGFAWLGSLGFTQLSFARLALLGLLGLRRFAQPRILARCSHHWLPSLSLRRLASALARVARLASRAKRHSASLDLRRWLARIIPGLLSWSCWLSCWCLRSALIALHFARPRVASLSLTSLARVAGLLLASLAPVARLASASAHLALLGLHCFAHVLSVKLTNRTIRNL
jgi:hypothetical protein